METTSLGIWIPREIWQNEDLTVTEKLFIVKIDALDGEKGCYASNRYFSEFFKLSKSRCSAVIKNLKDKGYIAIHYAYEEGKNAIERRVIKVKKALYNMLKTTKSLGGSKEILKDEKEEVTNEKEDIKNEKLDIENKKQDIQNEIECLELSGRKRKITRTRTIEENLVDIDNIEDEIKNEIKQLCIETIEDPIQLDINEVEEEVLEENTFQEETNTENIKFNSGNNKSTDNKNKNIKNIDNKNNNKTNNGNSNKIIYEEIINYLNLKCNKNFKYTTEKTIRCINARIREGNTLEDFKKVIDKKCDEWSNTTMKVYLRPETLFGTKFERYLTEDVKDRENHFKRSNWTGGQAYGKQFKNVRNSGQNKETEERIRFGNITPLTAEEIEWAERELF